MDTGTTERGAVAGPRRATHGPAVGHRNLVGCSKKEAMRSRMMRHRGVVPEAAGCMVVACFLVRLGARRSTQAQILPAAVFCATVRADRCLPLPSHGPRVFQTAPGSTVWIGDSASSVHVTDSGKFVYSKWHPLPAEAFLLIGVGRKLNKGGVFWVTRGRLSLQG